MSIPPGISFSGADYQAGDTISGRWQVRSICGGRGRSGMGVVYVVDDRLRGEVLAVKTLQPQFVANHRVRELLRREANAWLGMGRHPNIVALNFVEALGTQIYLFMDYVAPDEHGRNCLTQWLTGNPLQPIVVAKWSIDTCLALAYMREHGIEVHRDIKPDNLMIDNERNVRVTDFGLARAFSGVTGWNVGEALPNVTAVGAFVGTPGYIAPDVVAGDAPSVASDVYAFGLVMVQMLTGKQWAPFTGEWRGDIEEFERTTMKVRESLHQPISGTPFDEIVSKCLEYDTAKRWSDFGEIAHALSAACQRHGIGISITRQAATPAVVEPDADHVTALYNLGRLQEALEAVRRLREGDPLDARLLTCEGVIRGDLGDLAGAIPLLEQACVRAPGSCSNWNNFGRALRQAKRSAEALDAFQRAIDCDNTHANIWASKGNSLFDLGRFQEALEAYDHAVSLDRYHWASQLGRGQVLDKLERWVDALVALESVLDVEPEDAEARRLYAACESRLRGSRGTALSDVEALTHLQKGEFAEALRAAREARVISGPTSNLWNIEGAVLLTLGDARAALRCLERAQRLEPTRSDVWANKARAYSDLRQPQEALRCYEKATDLQPQDWMSWLGRYVCCNQLGLAEQARSNFRSACANARLPEQRRTCMSRGLDLYYLTMADIAYSAADYAEAHRCAASVARESALYPEAEVLLARSRYHLATAFVQRDLAGDASGFVAVARVLQLVADHLPNEKERERAYGELDVVLQNYIVAADKNKLVEMPDQTPARNLAILVARYCRVEWALSWSRYRLFESLAREANSKITESLKIWEILRKAKAGAP
jgi:tetratricopeptide (TPR) repeat protein